MQHADQGTKCQHKQRGRQRRKNVVSDKIDEDHSQKGNDRPRGKLESAAIGRQTNTRWSSLFSEQATWVFLAAVVAAVVLSLVTDTFASPHNIFNVTRNFAFVGIVALGMTVVIISGGIDLSVGSVVCLGAMVQAICMNAGYAFLPSAAVALAASATVGLLNGALIAWLRIPPFVVTLGTLSIARSFAMVLSDNRMIFEFGPDQALLFEIGGGSTYGIAHPVVALVSLGLITSFALRWTRWGTHVFAIGANERAAVLTGVRVPAVKISVYVFSSTIAGLTGILEAGWLGGVTTNLGQSMELTEIAATVIGGANLLGGSGTIFGAIVGAALIEIIRNSLILLGIRRSGKELLSGSSLSLRWRWTECERFGK